MSTQFSPAMYANAAAGRVNSLITPNQGNEAPRKYDAFVAENYLQKNGLMVYAICPALFPLGKGHSQVYETPIKRSFTDFQGRKVIATGNHTNVITCEYYSTDTFRKTPPNVQRGERIKIWPKPGSPDLFYWEPTSQDTLSARRGETVVHGINADKPDGKDSGTFSADNSYFTEMSSHNKSYTVSTSQANGEVSAYKFQMNGKDGSVVIEDAHGNLIELHTPTGKIWMKNNCGTLVKLEQNSIEVFCNENYTEHVGQNKKIEVGGDYNIKVGGNLNIEVGGNIAIKASGVKCDTPECEITGALKVGNGISVSGGGGAAASISGNVEVTGNIHGSGTLSSSGPVDFPAGGNISGYD